MADESIEMNPLLRTLRNEENAELMRHILKLPETHRAVLILKYYNNFKTEEIAEAMEIPPGTVKSRIHTAKQMLRDSMTVERRK